MSNEDVEQQEVSVVHHLPECIKSKVFEFQARQQSRHFPSLCGKPQQDNTGWHWYLLFNFTFETPLRKGHKITVTVNLTRDRLTQRTKEDEVKEM